MSPPKYDLREFLDACLAGRGQVVILGGARTTAQIYYGLETEAAVVSFIANGGLEPPRRFLDSTPLREFRNFEGQVTDAYEFMIHGKKGYISLFKGATGKWIVKSFHPQEVLRLAATMAEEEERRKFGYNGYEQEKRKLGGDHGND